MSEIACEDAPRPHWPIALAVGALGASAVLTQLTLLRELLTVFAGNELVFGVILGNWMLLTGLGAAAGRVTRRLGRPAAWLSAGLIVLAVLPISAVLALRLLRNAVFLRGAALGLTEAAVGGFVLLAPYCLCSGFLLTLACTAASRRKDAAGIARVYFFDSVGGVVGGLAFSFVLVHLLGHVGILQVCAAVDLLAAGILAGSSRRWVQYGAAVVLAAALGGLVASVDIELWSVQRQHPRKRIVYHGNSPYGQLLVTADAEQHNFFSNGLPMLSTHDVDRVEETVHYAMAQRPEARNVLLVGGGVSGTAREILKYPVRRVDYVELDPLILKVGERYLPDALADPRIHVAATDGRLFVKRAARRYDVVIVDVPDPSTLQINRFYTVEFFRQVKRILSDGGVLCFSLGQYVELVDENLASLIAVAHRTLREVFLHVLILPPGRIFFLASDSDAPLTADVAGRIELRGIPTRLVRRSYLRSALSRDRLDAVAAAVRDDAEVNRDFSPVLYLHQLRHWMDRFPVRYGLLGGGLAVVLVIYLLWIRPVTFAIFTTGFAASSLEIVLLVGFQILHGLVYHKVGIVVTMFMLGLAGGSLLVGRVLTGWGRRHLIGLELAVGAFAALLPLVLLALGRLGPRWETISAEIVLPLLTLLLAVLVGMEVPLAARVDFRGVAATAGRMFLADLIGACLGAMLVSAVLIPLVSLSGVCFLTAGLNLVGALVLIFTRRGAAREVS